MKFKKWHRVPGRKIPQISLASQMKYTQILGSQFSREFSARPPGVAFRPQHRSEAALGFFCAPVDMVEWFWRLFSHIQTCTMIKYIHTNTQYQLCANIQQSQSQSPVMVPKWLSLLPSTSATRPDIVFGFPQFDIYKEYLDVWMAEVAVKLLQGVTWVLALPILHNEQPPAPMKTSICTCSSGHKHRRRRNWLADARTAIYPSSNVNQFLW